jgi:hypothetical protein
VLSSALYFDVYLGAHNVRVSEPTRLEIRATEKYIHPNWNSATLNGDIALIKLPAPVDISGGNPILDWDNNISKIIILLSTNEFLQISSAPFASKTQLTPTCTLVLKPILPDGERQPMVN